MKFSRFILTVSFMLLFSSSFLYSQKYLIHTYTEEDDLPSSFISSITQDSSGRIWLATKKGICIYDGTNWTQYFRNGKPIADCAKLRVDEKGKLWSLEIDHKIKLTTLRNNKWIDYVYPNLNKTTFNKYMVLFHITSFDNNTCAAICTFDTNVYYFKNGNWSNIGVKDGLPATNITAVYNEKDLLYIGTQKGLFTYQNGKLNSEYNNKYNLSNETVYAVSIIGNAGQKRIWIYTGNFIGYIENNKLTKVVQDLKIKYDSKNFPFNFLPNYFKSIIHSNILKVYLYNSQNGTNSQFGRSQGLIDNGCSDIMVDKENILWIASYRGLSKISSLRFKNFYQSDGMLEDEVASIIQRKNGDYILGHNGGLSIFDGNSFKNIEFHREFLYERVNGMVNDKKGNVWFSSFRNGIGVLSPDNKIKWFANTELGVSGVLGISIDSSGKIYFTDNSGVFTLSNGKAQKYMEGKFAPSFIRGVFCLSQNRLLITTSGNGIYIVKNGFIKNYRNSKQDQKANNVFSYYEFPNGKMWLGTDDGVYEVEGDTLKKILFNKESLNKSIYFILNDKKGSFWLGTDFGLFRWNGNKLWQYGVKEGLAGLETNRSAAYIMPDGRLMFGTNRGMSIYRSDFDIDRSVLPITELLHVECGGEKYSPYSPISLSSSNNDVIFNFNVISFYNENNNSVLYKLEPLDADWIEMKNIPQFFVRYPNLKSGNYIFRLKAKNALGIWGNEVKSARITVEEPFYNHPLAILFAIIGLIVLIYFYVIVRTNKKYRIKLQEEVKERTKQLRHSERRYKQMFDENNAIMLILNPETGMLLDANPSALKFFQIQKSDLYKYSIYNFSDSPFELYQNSNTQLPLKEIEISQFIEENNSIRYLKIHISKIENENQSMLYCIIDDITQQKKASIQMQQFNEELENRVSERTADLEQAMLSLNEEVEYRTQAEQELISAKDELELSLSREKELSKLKSQFISMVSHEYRTPLTVIFSSAELIKEFTKIKHEDAVIEYSKRIQDSVKTLTELLEGVMAVGEGTVVKAFKEDFELKEFLTFVLKSFTESIKPSHNIVTKIEFDKLIIKQDRNLLKQIITQLLSNAAKFSEKNSDIILEAKNINDKVTISVIDSGRGIKEQELEIIFEPFYRSADVIGIIPGTGLGLSIAQKNIEAIGGEITVESVFGKGSVFHINL